MRKAYEVHAIHMGTNTHYRFSIRKEGGRTYHSPLFFLRAEDAADKACRMIAAGR